MILKVKNRNVIRLIGKKHFDIKFAPDWNRWRDFESKTWGSQEEKTWADMLHEREV